MTSAKTKMGLAKQERPNERYKLSTAPTISFSISYVRVCEWAQYPDKTLRPQMPVLEQAAQHATKIGDKYILKKIEDARAEWLAVDKTATPKTFKKAETNKKDTNRDAIKKVAVFGPAKDYFSPTASRPSRFEKEQLVDLRSPKRFATAPYSFTPNSKEVVRIPGKDNLIERELIKFLNKFK